ncbi:MAG: response regulator [Bacteroidota bacterium]|nr:MAG: response regulator [Bacteroidota bacterium]
MKRYFNPMGLYSYILAVLLFFFPVTIYCQSDITQLEQKVTEYASAGNKVEQASALNKLALLLWQSGELDAAVSRFDESLQINTELKNANAQRIIHGYLGLIYLEKEDYSLAVKNFSKSIELGEAKGRKQDLVTDYYNLALAYQGMGNFVKSNEQAHISLELSLESNNLKSTKSNYLLLAENSEKQGNNKLSAEYYEQYNALTRHLQKEQMQTLEAEKNQIASQIERKEHELRSALDTLDEVMATNRAIQLQQDLREAQIREEQAIIRAREQLRKSQIFYLTIALGLFMSVLILLVIQSRLRKRNNTRLKEQNAEIEKQKLEIEKQRDLANKQRKNLTDSIQYARRIQSAVIPRQESLHNNFNDSFIFYQPRDIVSGDFYWFARKDNIFVIAAADCTGHGVPGAFMSMLGVAYLNEIVNKIAINIHINALNADDILNQLREKIIDSLHQSENLRDPKDGMDIALCIIDFEKKRMQFSGAYNPLILIRKGELMHHAGDKMPVSYHTRRDIPFSRKVIDLKENDCIYLFTDGFIDQFGGKDGQKFLMKNFTALLQSMHHKPMQEQKEILKNTFDSWKGEYTQIDDVLVIGFRFVTALADRTSDWQSKTVLIAEDTDINFFLMAEVLKKTKVKLLRVKNGAEAVELVKSNHVDLVLMDINMPTMDGYEATKLIKEFRSEIPIIIQTAIHEDGYERAMKAGANDFIAKPIDLKLFMEKIANFLN